MKSFFEKLKPLLAYILPAILAAGLVKGGDYLSNPDLAKDVCSKVNAQAK